jgi:dihydrodipicolinate reductase
MEASKEYIMHVLLGGCGKMAMVMGQVCNQTDDVHLTQYPRDFDYSNKEYGDPIGVYFGSPEKFPDYLKFCEGTKIPVILGSTKVSLPKSTSTIVMVMPNLSIEVLNFLPTIVDGGKKLLSSLDADIVESHPAHKKDISGTARTVAKEWGIEEHEIAFYRKRSEHLAMGVPRSHLGAHAFHEFIFSNDDGVELGFFIKILGRETYAKGAIRFARAFFSRRGKEPQRPGFYQWNELIHLAV